MPAYPGLVWNWQSYLPRWPFGVDGDTKVYGVPAGENIPPGVLVQQLANGSLQIARDLTNLAGVSVYDPNFHSKDVLYQQYDVVPVLRKGRVYVVYSAKRDPLIEEQASVYLGAGFGLFTTDAAGTRLPRASFTIDSQRQYINAADTVPAQDIPPPGAVNPPLGVTQTTFGMGVALVELNF